MGRTCTVCAHKDVDEINRLLLSGTSFRDIAGQFDLSKTALARHKESHIPELLSKSEDIKEVVSADNLLAQLQEARTSALDLLDKAIEAGNTKVYGPPSSYLSEIRQQIKLWAELEGRLASQPQVNITLNAEWISLRSTIITALEPFPEARRAVIDALP
ncbi:MAG: hypothetical protein QG575_1819 [Euryarchaeota archaeon]|nr:hypothetical protein [Euryarchaeota archaeon]